MDTTPKPDELLQPPTPPEDWECCGSECGDACIFQIYYRQKEAYDKQQRELAQMHTDVAK